MHEVLQVCIHSFAAFFGNAYSSRKETSEAQQTFSSSEDPTVWRTIPVLEFLQENWGNMANHPRFSELSDAIHAGMENLGKWYRKMSDTDAYFMCLGTFFPLSQMVFANSQAGSSA